MTTVFDQQVQNQQAAQNWTGGLDPAATPDDHFRAVAEITSLLAAWSQVWPRHYALERALTREMRLHEAALAAANTTIEGATING